MPEARPGIQKRPSGLRMNDPGIWMSTPPVGWTSPEPQMSTLVMIPTHHENLVSLLGVAGVGPGIPSRDPFVSGAGRRISAFTRTVETPHIPNSSVRCRRRGIRHPEYRYPLHPCLHPTSGFWEASPQRWGPTSGFRETTPAWSGPASEFWIALRPCRHPSPVF